MERYGIMVGSIFGMLPHIAVWLVGLVLSLVRWQRNPRPSRLTFIALAGFLVTSVFFTYVRIRSPLIMQERGWSAVTYGVINGIHSVVSAGLWVLVLAAIFGGGGGREHRDSEYGGGTAGGSHTGDDKAVSSDSRTKQRVGKGLLVAGWIFSILGGFIGIAIASCIAFGKKYDDESRSKGRAMFITALILFVIYIFIRIAVRM